MKESKLYRYFLAAIVAVALGVPAIASADAKSDLKGVSVKVSYADLNLEKQEGAKALYRRLQQASRQVCNVDKMPGIVPVKQRIEVRQCYKDALTSAVEEIDSELLTQIHNS